jgi:broad specificity phosphatase PhoE
MQDIGNAHCPEGESVKELGERIMTELTKIAEENDGKTVVVATHATPIRVAQTLIQYGTLEEMKNVKWVSNASVTILESKNGKWSCPKVSIDEHLADLKTALPTNV